MKEFGTNIYWALTRQTSMPLYIISFHPAIKLRIKYIHPQLSQSAQAAIMKYYRLNGLNTRRLLLTVLEPAQSEIKEPADSVPGENSFPGLQTVIFLLCPHTTGRSSGVSSSSYKGTNHIMGAPLSWPHLNQIISQRPYLQISLYLVLRFHHVSWGPWGEGYTNIHSITLL